MNFFFGLFPIRPRTVISTVYSEILKSDAIDMMSVSESPGASLTVHPAVTVPSVRPSTEKGSIEKLPMGFPDLYAVPSRREMSIFFAGLYTSASNIISAESNPFIFNDFTVKDRKLTFLMSFRLAQPVQQRSSNTADKATNLPVSDLSISLQI